MSAVDDIEKGILEKYLHSTVFPAISQYWSISMMTEIGTDWKDHKDISGYFVRLVPDGVIRKGKKQYKYSEVLELDLGRWGVFVVLEIEIVRMGIPEWGNNVSKDTRQRSVEYVLGQ